MRRSRQLLVAAAVVGGSLFTGTASASAATAGGVFVTCHDPDFHAVQGGNTAGAQHIIEDGVAYVTHGKTNPRVLLVTDLRNPGSGYSDPRLGVTAAGFSYDLADDGTAGGSVLDLHTVNFSNYDVIIVASDFGGWLEQSEVNILVARRGELSTYVNNGGGVVALAESGTGGGGTSTSSVTTNQFAYLPYFLSTAAEGQSESGFTVTPDGQAIGLTNSDVNGNASHCVIPNPGTLTVFDRDASGNIISIGTNQVLPPPGLPEAPLVVLLPIIAAAAGGAVLVTRHRRRTPSTP